MENIKEIKKTVKKNNKIFFNIDEACIQYNITDEEISELKEMTKSSELIPKAFPKRYLLVSLIAFDKNKEKCLENIENYCKFLRQSPEFFANRDISCDEVQQVLKTVYNVSLPPTPENCNLVLLKLSDFDPNIFDFDGQVKTSLMMCELQILLEGPRNGLVIIFDMEGSQVGHVLKTPLKSVRKCLNFINKACLCKIKTIHVLNTPSFIKMILAIVKPVLKANIFNVIQWHSKDMDMEKFYKEQIPKRCLPAEYGGDLESIEVLHNKTQETLMKMREHFLIQDRLINFEFDGIPFEDY